MSEPKTAVELVEELKTLCCTRWRGVYCDICAVPLLKAYTSRQVKAWKEKAISACLNIASQSQETAIDRQQRIAVALRALPVEPA